jgi:hypothetical protein
MKSFVEQALQDLVLARLSVPRARALSPSELGKSLYSFVALGLTQAEWAAQLATVLGSLRDAGLVEVDSLVLLSRGHKRLQTALGLSGPPSAKNWRIFKSTYLPRLALPKAKGLRVDPAIELLAERLQSPSDTHKTVAALVNAWLVRSLGVRSKKMTLEVLRATLLARELGVPARPTLDEVVRLGAARLAGATNGGRDELVRAVTARWLLAGNSKVEVRSEAGGASVSTARKSRPGSASGPGFVQKVRAAANAPTVRRFGSDKVFISSVWEALHRDPEMSALGEVGFKRGLIAAHRDGALVLTRADLVAAMDPEDVAASETRHLNATYHFIQM